ncbi:hypothetical protein [Polaromonas sp.]|uniref:hypothetical protein n=1 Tax=Polaromonas sp. TaxID=1869339 RepID=UPI0032644DE5
MSLSSPSAVSLYDARPFFEKALQHGVRSGIIGPEKIEAMRAEGPKGMVQIARYFGNEFLRPELEKARDRMVNLISLHLESTSGGDLKQAAESLRDFSLLSRSKGGSDMLKALIAMPQNSHFGMNERGGFRDEHIPLLAKWSLRSLADYQAELARRSQVAHVVNAALWMAGELGVDADELEEAGKDADAVIRTALLVMAAGRTEMPDWVAFEKMIALLRKKHGAAPAAMTVAIPKKLPAQLQAAVEAARQSVMADAPKILDATVPVRSLFDRSPAFMGRYFWVDDGLNEIDHHDRAASAAWNKVTGGNADDGSLLTLFLCVAAAAPPKTMLTEKSAATLVRKIRKSGFMPALAHQYIADHAPVQHQDAYASLWEAFVDEAQATLESDAVHSLNDALALLRRECHVQ